MMNNGYGFSLLSKSVLRVEKEVEDVDCRGLFTSILHYQFGISDKNKWL